jgi:hypothetical protein
MDKNIEVEWPCLKIKVEARLLTEKNPELCDRFWVNLPFESLQFHCLLAGDEVCTFPPFSPPDLSDPELVKFTIPIAEAPVGMIIWATLGHVCMYYGPVGEPWQTIPIAQVREEDVDKVKQVGKAQLESHLFTKEPITVIYRRKG